MELPSALDLVPPCPRGQALRKSLCWALLLIGVGFCASACGSKTPPPAAAEAPPDAGLSVLLVTLDTTRLDALACYGTTGSGSGEFSAAAGATPILDGLAERGVRYRNATTVAPLTMPAHSSMLTGQIPPVHGIRENGLWSLPPQAESIAEKAQRAGYRTAAFIGSVVLDRSYGLNQGFEVYDQPERPQEETSTHFVDRPANQVIDAAVAWNKGLERDERSFQWVHLFDPHQPYEPPAAWRQEGASQHELYQGEVSFVDSQLGRLIEQLKSSERMDNTLIIICADHGESLGEHGEWSHAAYCFEATMHIPFLVVYPNGYRAGEVSEETISVVDVAATALEAMGLGDPESEGTFEDGLSLFGRTCPSDRKVYFESFSGNISFGWAPIVGQRSKHWKTLISPHGQLFDLASDPDEANDLATEQVQRLNSARSWLAQTLSQAERRALGVTGVSSSAAAIDLAALGYTAAATGSVDLPDPLGAGHLPAPQDCAQEYQDTLRANALENEGHHEEAQRLAHRIVTKNSGNVVALQAWTSALLSLKRYAEAVPPLQRLVRLRPLTAGFHYNLGIAFSHSSQEDAGIESLWRAVELDLEHEAYLAELQQLLRSLGRREQFEAYAKRWQALKSESLSKTPR